MAGNRPSFSWVIILLSKVNSPSLRVVEFSIRSSELRSLNLQGLELILSDVRFGGLKSVAFLLESQREARDPIAHVRKRMPLLSEKGLLRFETGSH